MTSAPTAAGSAVRDRRRARTRADILDAAWRLAERDGIAGLSLRDLAGEVGMRAPSLYTYFPSKAAIYDAMFATGYRQFDEAMSDLPIDPDDPVGSVTAAIERFLAFCGDSVARYQLLFTRALPDWTPSPEAYEVSLASYDRTVERLTRLGLGDAGSVDLMTALTAGMAAQQLANDPGGERWVRLARDAAEMFVTHAQRR